MVAASGALIISAFPLCSLVDRKLNMTLSRVRVIRDRSIGTANERSPTTDVLKYSRSSVHYTHT